MYAAAQGVPSGVGWLLSRYEYHMSGAVSGGVTASPVLCRDVFSGPWAGLPRVKRSASGLTRAMPTLSALELFAIAAFALIVIPGPSVLYIVSQSVGHGRKGGLAAVLGIETGAFVHVAGAALGVSAILASSAAGEEVDRAN